MQLKINVSTEYIMLPLTNNKQNMPNFNLFLFDNDFSNKIIIVITNDGTSATIVESSEELLHFNKNGIKTQFVGPKFAGFFLVFFMFFFWRVYCPCFVCVFFLFAVWFGDIGRVVKSK